MPALGTGIVFATMITMMPIETCEAIKAEHPQMLCVDVEPACGGEAEVPCVAQEVTKPTYRRVTKPTYRRVYYRKNGRLLYRTVKR